MPDPSPDAFATLKDLLNRYGLGTLADWAWNEMVQGRSANEITLELMDRPEFQQRFPAIALRRAQGQPAISPAEYLSYEDQARQIMRSVGFPASFYDQPDDFTNFIAADVSLAELSQRATLYQQAAFQAPQETRDQLRTLYGITEGDIAAYLADEQRALPILQQKVTSAGIAGEAQRQRFGQLTAGEAERLAGLGVSTDQAAQGFGAVAQADELFRALPGEQTGAPGRSEALGFVAGDVGAQQAIDEQARRRKAAFGAGGSYATGQTGVSGLASANT